MTQMVFFPHAGGFAAGYLHLASQLEKASRGRLKTLVYEYAGRGRQAREPEYTDFSDAVSRITKDLTAHFFDGSEIIFFGHSMGTYVALETAYALRRMYGVYPKQMFLSGQSGPYHEPDFNHEMTDEEGIAYLRALGGTSEEILSNPAFYKKLYSYVKKDITMLDRYDAATRSVKLDSDLYIMNGKRDPELKEDRLPLWQEITTGACEIRMFSGGHFYINENLEEVTEYLNSKMKGILH